PRPPKSAKKPHHGKNRPPHAGKPEQSRPKRPDAPAPKLKIDLFGAHAVSEAWKNPRRFVHALYITEAALGGFPVKTGAKRPDPTIVTKEQLDKALPP